MSMDAHNPGASTPRPPGSAAAALGRLSLATRIAGLRPELPIEVPVALLRTQRMILRPLRSADRPEFLRVLATSREHLRRFCPLADPTRPSQSDADIFERQLDLAMGAQATGRAWRAAAFDIEGRLVGGFNLNDLSRGLEHTAELVVWTSAPCAGKGYGAEGAQAVLNHAFADAPQGLGLHRISALIAPDNTPCLALARKAGFKRSARQTIELLLGGERIAHNVYEAFAPVPPAAPVVESKPSMGQAVFGTGLLSILRTEAAHRHGKP